MPTRTARLVRHHPLLTIFFTLVVVIGGPTAIVLASQHRTDVKLQAQNDGLAATNQRLLRANRRFVDYQVRQKVQTCEGQNRSRKAIQTVLDRAAHPPPTGAAAIDLTAVEGFGRLDANQQSYLRNLQATLARPVTSSNLEQIAADYRRDNPSDQDCPAQGRNLRMKLEGHHA